MKEERFFNEKYPGTYQAIVKNLSVEEKTKVELEFKKKLGKQKGAKLNASNQLNKYC